MDGTLLFILTGLLYLSSGLISASILYNKGYRDLSVGLVFLIGCIVPFFGMAIPIILPSKNATQADASAVQRLSSGIPNGIKIAIIVWPVAFISLHLFIGRTVTKSWESVSTSLDGPAINTSQSDEVSCGVGGLTTGLQSDCDRLEGFVLKLYGIRDQNIEGEDSIEMREAEASVSLAEARQISNWKFNEVSAERYFSDYKNYSQQADMFYKNKTLFLTGELDHAMPPLGNEVTLVMKAGDANTGVIAKLAPVQLRFGLGARNKLNSIISALDRISFVNQGDTIRLVCKGAGQYDSAPQVDTCLFLE